MPTFTLSALEQLAWDQVEQNTVLYTQTEVDRVINEALCVLNLFTGFYQKSIQVPGFSVANQLLYNTPTGIILPIRVQFEGRQLEPYKLSEISKFFYSWMTDTTASRGPVAHWVPIGATIFALHPMDARGGGDILVTGIAEPPALVNPDDAIQLEDEYVEIIASYCAHRLPLKEGGKVFADASRHYQIFLRAMKEKKLWTQFKAPKYWVPNAIEKAATSPATSSSEGAPAAA